MMLDYKTKPADYYAHQRREIIDEVDPGANAVLEVGCAEGRLGAALKAEGRARGVTGLELMEEAAAQARQVLDQVLVGNLEQMELPFPRDEFDVIICADVLEHLVDPWAQLKRLMLHLKPGGTVIVSLPNVRNWRVLAPLLFKGRWEYQDAGIMDKTHLRFFTRQDMIAYFVNCGLDPVKVTPLGNRSRKFYRFGLKFLSELFAVQYVLVGVKK